MSTSVYFCGLLVIEEEKRGDPKAEGEEIDPEAEGEEIDLEAEFVFIEKRPSESEGVEEEVSLKAEFVFIEKRPSESAAPDKLSQDEALKEPRAKLLVKGGLHVKDNYDPNAGFLGFGNKNEALLRKESNLVPTLMKHLLALQQILLTLVSFLLVLYMPGMTIGRFFLLIVMVPTLILIYYCYTLVKSVVGPIIEFYSMICSSVKSVKIVVRTTTGLFKRK